ncbi:MAG: FAD-dependent oxidoreductase [Acidimicrobiia bacterium]|nr:FAD-dependent oxidoreductase [Acidimicrobiia bacterium]
MAEERSGHQLGRWTRHLGRGAYPSGRMATVQGADVVIVGAGVVGAAAAWRLASLGADVALLDRAEVASGASGVNAGMVDAPGWGRPDEHPDLETTLKMGSWELYQRVHLEEGEPIGFRRSGSVAAIATEAEWELAKATVDAARARGQEAELLSSAELRSLEPEASPLLLGARWSPLAAQADPAEATRALARLAARAGARVLEGHAVVHLRPRGEGFVVATELGELHCGALVLAAGAWLGPLAHLLGVDVGVVAVRGQMWATAPLPPRLFSTFSAMESPLAWATAPIEAGTPPQLTHDGGVRRARHLYGRQNRTGEVIVGGDRQLAPADLVPTADPAGIAENRAQAVEVLPFLDGAPATRTWAGLMPFSLDGRPFLGRLPGPGRLFVAGGLASSGFNRGPMAGWLVADLVAGRPVPPCLSEAEPSGRVRERNPSGRVQERDQERNR